MSYQPIQGTGSNDLAQLNKMVAQLNHEQQVKIFKGPNGYNAITTGQLKDLGYGTTLRDTDGNIRIAMYIDANNEPVLKVSKEGFDATTASADNLYFNSGQNIFKIVQKYTLTVDPTANTPGTYGSYTATQAHGLGSPRAIYGFVDSSLGGRTNLPHTEMIVVNTGGTDDMFAGTYKWIEVDNTNITARVETTTLQLATYEFTVYLQQETAE